MGFSWGGCLAPHCGASHPPPPTHTHTHAHNFSNSKVVVVTPIACSTFEDIYGGARPDSVSIVTLSCEVDDGDAFLKHLRARRVQVSLGHCNASFERAAAAVAAGAAAVTHMFNCCSSLSNRNPGYTGLLPPPSTCAIGLIADGVHVHDASLMTGAPTTAQDETQNPFSRDHRNSPLLRRRPRVAGHRCGLRKSTGFQFRNFSNRTAGRCCGAGRRRALHCGARHLRQQRARGGCGDGGAGEGKAVVL